MLSTSKKKFRRVRHSLRPIVEACECRRLMAGTGLTGNYFDTADFGFLKQTRTDASVDFNWGAGSPMATVATDTFSVRWTGQVEAVKSEAYTFHVQADDGVRLWVNDHLLITNWMNGAGRELTGRIALRAGERYDIKLEYFDSTGNAQAKLSWSSPTTPKQVIPQSQLYPTATFDDRGGLVEETWNNIPGGTIPDLTAAPAYAGPASARKYINTFESTIATWADSYGRRVRGYIVAPMTGAFTFAVSGDDAVELFLSTDANPANATRIAFTSGGTPVRNFTQSPTQQSATITLQQGVKYYVELRQKESSGADHYAVAWKTPLSSSFNVIDAGSLAFFNSDATLPAVGSILANLSTARPRLVGTQDMFELAKSRINSGGQYTGWYNALKTSANAVITKYADVNTKLAFPGAAGTQTVLAALMDDLSALAGAYRLVNMVEGAAAANGYATKAIEMMKRAVASDWTTWDGGNQALGIGMAGQGFALCYDWMNSAIAPADKQIIAGGLMRLAVRPVTATLNAGNYWVNYNNNWVFVVAGGTVSAALAIAGDSGAVNSEIETLISKSLPAVKKVMGHFAPSNGGWNEGPGYQGYGGMHLIHLLASLETGFGTDYGLSRTPGFEGYANFILYQTSQQTKQTYHFGDGNWSQNGDAMNFWLARRFNRPDAAAGIRPLLGTGARAQNFLYYDARGNNPGTTAARDDFNFYGDQSTYKSEHVATFRDSWNHLGNGGASVMVKGGYDGDNAHDHLDTGSFLFDAGGYRWAEDTGNEVYSIPTLAGRLFNTYRRRAEGQNTLVINPTANDYKSSTDAQVAALNADQVYDTTANAPIIRQLSTDRASVALVDMTSTYAKMRVQKVMRGFYFDRKDDSLLVQDEITAASPAEVFWGMHFRYAPGNASYVERYDISNDGKTITLWRGQQRLHAQILSGTGRFEVVDAVPMASSPNPAGQASNTGFKKLIIHMEGVTNERLSVWMVPLAAGQAAPTTTPAITPLATWYPPEPRRAWVGDIDQYQRNGTSDDPAVDAQWRTDAFVTTGRPRVGFDVVGVSQTVPFTVNLNLQPGETVTSARLVVGLRGTAAASTATDLLYIDDMANAFNYAQLGWGTIDGTPVAREYDLASQLSRLQDGTLNLAFTGSTSIDWASVVYETSLATTVRGDVQQANQNDVFRLVRNGDFAEVFINSAATPAARWPIDAASLSPFAIEGLGGDDTLQIDFSGGDPMPLAGFRFDGGAGVDTATLINTSADANIALGSGLSVNGGTSVDIGTAEAIVLAMSGANAVLDVDAGSLLATALRVNILAGGRVRTAATSVLPAFTAIDIAAGGTFDLAGRSQAIDVLTGVGSITTNGAAATLTIGAAGGSSTFAGALTNGPTAGQTLSLTKAGAGTITLAGSSLFSGMTRITSGALRVEDPLALGTTAGGVFISGSTSTARLELAGGITLAESITLEAKAANTTTSLIPPSVVNFAGNNALSGAIEIQGGGTGQAFESLAGRLTLAGAINRTDGSNYHRPFQLRGAGEGVVSGNMTSATALGFAIQKFDGGTWTLDGTIATAGITSVNAGLLRVNGLMTQSSGVVINGNDARLEFGRSQTLPSLSIAGGATVALTGTNGTTTLVTRSLSIPTAGTGWAGTLDLRDGSVVIDYVGTASSPYAQTLAQLVSGREGGAWTGTGIVSSTLPTSGGQRGVGIAESSSHLGLVDPASGLFYGATVDATSVLLTATLAGDINLDRTVNFSDLVLLAQNYNKPGQTWRTGDTDLDGDVDFADLVLLAQSYGKTISFPVPATLIKPASVSGSPMRKARQI